MLSPRLTNCPECANIPDLLNKIDCKLAELGNSLYNNISYMLNKPIAAGDILQLIGYKRILTYKYVNPDYAQHYSIAMIASKVIRLTVGCKANCNCNDRGDGLTTTSTSTSTTTCPPTTTTTTTPPICKIYTLDRTNEAYDTWEGTTCVGNSFVSATVPVSGYLNTACIRQGSLVKDASLVIVDTNDCDACISYVLQGRTGGGTWSAEDCDGNPVGGSAPQATDVNTNCITINTLVLTNTVIKNITGLCY